MRETAEPMLFATRPHTVPALEECGFYHTLEIPGVGLQVGAWDLRGHYDAYLGGHGFAGERVLDLGTASGALAFEIERRGAREVVAFDLAEGCSYDCRLPADAGTLAEFERWVQRVKNGFWLAHAHFGSRVKVAYGHVRHLPKGLGEFETVVMGNLLQHLQDPIGAVLEAARRTNHLIITEADWLQGTADNLPCMIMYDLPHPFSWYQVKPGLLQMLLERWGFTQQTLTWHTQVLLQGPQFISDGTLSWEPTRVPARHYTLSARRPGAPSAD